LSRSPITWLSGVTAAAVVAALAAGCAIQPDSAPRDIPDDHPERLEAVGNPAGGEARGSQRIYLVAPGDPALLRTVPRDAGGTPSDLIDELVNGPNTTERTEGLRSALPAGLAVRPVRVEDGVAHVDVSEAIIDLSPSEFTLAVAQIVFTASEIDGVNAVQIRVDGVTRELPNGEGVRQRGPLTVYDFNGFAESSQPAFPVSPTPTTAAPPPTTAPPTTTTPPTTTLATPTTTST
jgi:hypothetical protein